MYVTLFEVYDRERERKYGKRRIKTIVEQCYLYFIILFFTQAEVSCVTYEKKKRLDENVLMK